MDRILLTGGSGFVGQNLLSDKRFRKLEIISPNSNDLDLLKKKSIQNYLSKYKPTMIIHLAGKVGGILKNKESNYDFLRLNSLMNINLISSMIDFNIKKFINLGSSCIYPRDFSLPIKEKNLMSGTLEPTNEGYALSKIIGLKLLEYASKEKNTFYKTIIPCNLFGPYDSFDLKSSHMIPAVIRKIHEAKVSKEPYVSVWGDGKVKREFMYVTDLIEFLFFAINNLESLPNLINIGTGVDYSINEYYNMISDVISFKGKFIYDLSKPTGMKRKLVDISLSKKLGWKSKYSIKYGLNETYKFYKKNYV